MHHLQVSLGDAPHEEQLPRGYFSLLPFPLPFFPPVFLLFPLPFLLSLQPSQASFLCSCGDTTRHTWLTAQTLQSSPGWVTLGNHVPFLHYCAQNESNSPLGFLLPLLSQLSFPSRPSTAPHEQAPWLITLLPPNHLFANAPPQGLAHQKEVLEAEPDREWQAEGLSAESPIQHRQQVLSLGGHHLDVRRAPSELPRCECVGRQWARSKDLAQWREGGARGLGRWASAPSPQAAVTQGSAPWISEAQGGQENSQSELSFSFIHSFIHPVLTWMERLLCVRHCAGPREAAVNEPQGAPSLVGEPHKA